MTSARATTCAARWDAADAAAAASADDVCDVGDNADADVCCVGCAFAGAQWECIEKSKLNIAACALKLQDYAACIKAYARPLILLLALSLALSFALLSLFLALLSLALALLLSCSLFPILLPPPSFPLPRLPYRALARQLLGDPRGQAGLREGAVPLRAGVHGAEGLQRSKVPFAEGGRAVPLGQGDPAEPAGLPDAGARGAVADARLCEEDVQERLSDQVPAQGRGAGGRAEPRGGEAARGRAGRGRGARRRRGAAGQSPGRGGGRRDDGH
eukprot:1952724-Rhodomonas_salina.1